MMRRLDRSLPALLLDQFREFRLFYAGALACLVATHAIQSSLPFIARDLAEIAEGGEGPGRAMFIWLALGIIVFRTSSRLLFFHPARVLQKNLRVELLDRLALAPPPRYRDKSPGQLFQTMFTDMEEMRSLTGFAILQMANIVVAFSVLVPRIVSFDARLLPAILPMVAAFALFSVIVSRNRKYYRAVQDAQGEVNNFIIESYAGKKAVKNHHAEKPFIDLFTGLCGKELGFFFKAGVGTSAAVPLIPLGMGLSLLWGAGVVQDEGLGAGALVLFTSFVFLFLEPLTFVSWLGVVVARAQGAWSRIKELVAGLDAESPLETRLAELEAGAGGTKDGTGVEAGAEGAESAEGGAAGMWDFRLDHWDRVARLRLRKGAWNAIAGPTGHGKTRLLLQLAWLRARRGARVSYVAQSPYLYNDTLGANVFLGREPSAKERRDAMELLALFGLTYLDPDPGRLLSLPVGEDGKKLSGGQRKRLALARSIAGGADLLLWDDPFSSVDLILEGSITRALRASPLLAGRTVVLTTHRLSTARSSEWIALARKGEGVVEQGETRELLRPGTEIHGHFKNQFV